MDKKMLEFKFQGMKISMSCDGCSKTEKELGEGHQIIVNNLEIEPKLFCRECRKK